MKLKAGDLVFVQTSGIISDAIRFFDKGRFNHVAIAVSENEIMEAQYNKFVDIVPMEYTNFAVVPVVMDDKRNELFQQFINENKGKFYDYPGLLRMIFDLTFNYHGFDKFNGPKSVICSELAADWLEKIGLAPRGTENLSPNQLYKFAKENLL